MHRCSWKVSAGLLAGLSLCLALTSSARAEEEWGTIKGQVIWGGDKEPERAKLNVNKDQMACLKNGALYSERWVVDPKTKGVRWVMFYLTDPKSPTKAIPTHPRLKKMKSSVEIDQPCCMFEPHMVALQQGQTLVLKNSSTIVHNAHLTSIPPGPNENPIIPPGRDYKIPVNKAILTPVSIKCDIHGWMQGWAFIVAHPYFAITAEDGTFEIKNAPAGEYRLVGWQEETGWVMGDGKKPNKKGKLITIKAGEVTDLGKITLKP